MTDSEFRVEVGRLVALWFSAASPSLAGVDVAADPTVFSSARVAKAVDFEQTASPPGCRSITSGPAESSAAAHVTGLDVLLDLTRDTSRDVRPDSVCSRAS